MNIESNINKRIILSETIPEEDSEDLRSNEGLSITSVPVPVALSTSSGGDAISEQTVHHHQPVKGKLHSTIPINIRLDQSESSQHHSFVVKEALQKAFTWDALGLSSHTRQCLQDISHDSKLLGDDQRQLMYLLSIYESYASLLYAELIDPLLSFEIWIGMTLEKQIEIVLTRWREHHICSLCELYRDHLAPWLGLHSQHTSPSVDHSDVAEERRQLVKWLHSESVGCLLNAAVPLSSSCTMSGDDLFCDAVADLLWRRRGDVHLLEAVADLAERSSPTLLRDQRCIRDVRSQVKLVARACLAYDSTEGQSLVHLWRLIVTTPEVPIAGMDIEFAQLDAVQSGLTGCDLLRPYVAATPPLSFLLAASDRDVLAERAMIADLMRGHAFLLLEPSELAVDIQITQFIPPPVSEGDFDDITSRGRQASLEQAILVHMLLRLREEPTHLRQLLADVAELRGSLLAANSMTAEWLGAVILHAALYFSPTEGHADALVDALLLHNTHDDDDNDDDGGDKEADGDSTEQHTTNAAAAALVLKSDFGVTSRITELVLMRRVRDIFDTTASSGDPAIEQGRHLLSRVRTPAPGVQQAEAHYDLLSLARSVNVDVIPLQLKSLTPEQVVRLVLDQLSSAYLNIDYSATDSHAEDEEEEALAGVGRRGGVRLPGQRLVDVATRLRGVPCVVDVRAEVVLAVHESALALGDMRGSYMCLASLLPNICECSATVADRVLTACELLLDILDAEDAAHQSFARELRGALLTHCPHAYFAKYPSVLSAQNTLSNSDSFHSSEVQEKLLRLIGILLADPGDSSLLLSPLSPALETVRAGAVQGLLGDILGHVRCVRDTAEVRAMLERRAQDLQRKMTSASSSISSSSSSSTSSGRNKGGNVSEVVVGHLVGMGFPRNGAIRAAAASKSVEQAVAWAIEHSADRNFADPVVPSTPVAGALLVPSAGMACSVQSLQRCLEMIATIYSHTTNNPGAQIEGEVSLKELARTSAALSTIETEIVVGDIVLEREQGEVSHAEVDSSEVVYNIIVEQTEKEVEEEEEAEEVEVPLGPDPGLVFEPQFDVEVQQVQYSSSEGAIDERILANYDDNSNVISTTVEPDTAEDEVKPSLSVAVAVDEDVAVVEEEHGYPVEPSVPGEIVSSPRIDDVTVTDERIDDIRDDPLSAIEPDTDNELVHSLCVTAEERHEDLTEPPAITEHISDHLPAEKVSSPLANDLTVTAEPLSQSTSLVAAGTVDQAVEYIATTATDTPVIGDEHLDVLELPDTPDSLNTPVVLMSGAPPSVPPTTIVVAADITTSTSMPMVVSRAQSSDLRDSSATAMSAVIRDAAATAQVHRVVLCAQGYTAVLSSSGFTVASLSAAIVAYSAVQPVDDERERTVNAVAQLLCALAQRSQESFEWAPSLLGCLPPILLTVVTEKLRISQPHDVTASIPHELHTLLGAGSSLSAAEEEVEGEAIGWLAMRRLMAAFTDGVDADVLEEGADALSQFCDELLPQAALQPIGCLEVLAGLYRSTAGSDLVRLESAKKMSASLLRLTTAASETGKTYAKRLLDDVATLRRIGRVAGHEVLDARLLIKSPHLFPTAASSIIDGGDVGGNDSAARRLAIEELDKVISVGSVQAWGRAVGRVVPVEPPELYLRGMLASLRQAAAIAEVDFEETLTEVLGYLRKLKRDEIIYLCRAVSGLEMSLGGLRLDMPPSQALRVLHQLEAQVSSSVAAGGVEGATSKSATSTGGGLVLTTADAECVRLVITDLTNLLHIVTITPLNALDDLYAHFELSSSDSDAIAKLFVRLLLSPEIGSDQLEPLHQVCGVFCAHRQQSWPSLASHFQRASEQVVTDAHAGAAVFTELCAKLFASLDELGVSVVVEELCSLLTAEQHAEDAAALAHSLALAKVLAEYDPQALPYIQLLETRLIICEFRQSCRPDMRVMAADFCVRSSTQPHKYLLSSEADKEAAFVALTSGPFECFTGRELRLLMRLLRVWGLSSHGSVQEVVSGWALWVGESWGKRVVGDGDGDEAEDEADRRTVGVVSEIRQRCWARLLHVCRQFAVDGESVLELLLIDIDILDYAAGLHCRQCRDPVSPLASPASLLSWAEYLAPLMQLKIRLALGGQYADETLQSTSSGDDSGSINLDDVSVLMMPVTVSPHALMNSPQCLKLVVDNYMRRLQERMSYECESRRSKSSLDTHFRWSDRDATLKDFFAEAAVTCSVLPLALSPLVLVGHLLSAGHTYEAIELLWHSAQLPPAGFSLRSGLRYMRDYLDSHGAVSMTAGLVENSLQLLGWEHLPLLIDRIRMMLDSI